MDDAERRATDFAAKCDGDFSATKVLKEFWAMVDRIRDQRAWIEKRYPDINRQIGGSALTAYERLTRGDAA